MSAPVEGCCPQCGRAAVASIEVRGVYDGTLIWQCEADHRWPRFPSGRLHDEAVRLIARTAPLDLSDRRS